MRPASLLLPLLAWAGVAGADAARAHQNYLIHCMGCHGEAGRGLEGHVPPFQQSLARIAASARGRDYMLRIPGVTQSTLDDAQTAEVLNWALAKFGNPDATKKIAPFTAAEVGRARAAPLLEVTATRGALLAEE
jgi:mono/diheme cytochrome c family protein